MPNILITILISHYCEKARWALERAGLPWTERAHLQGWHYTPAMRAARSKTVPVLIHNGGMLSESADILHWVDVQTTFDDIAAQLSDGRAFLMGDRCTAADIAFATMAAPEPARHLADPHGAVWRGPDPRRLAGAGVSPECYRTHTLSR